MLASSKLTSCVGRPTRHCGVDPKDLCVAADVCFLPSDVVEVIVALDLAKVSWFAIEVLDEGFLVGCLCWFALLFAIVLLLSNIGEANLRNEALLVVGGCYETSCNTLP